MATHEEAESLYIVVQQMLIILVCNILKENNVKRGQKQKQTKSDQDPLQALTLTTFANTTKPEESRKQAGA